MSMREVQIRITHIKNPGTAVFAWNPSVGWEAKTVDFFRLTGQPAYTFSELSSLKM